MLWGVADKWGIFLTLRNIDFIYASHERLRYTVSLPLSISLISLNIAHRRARLA
jgi:hypothetical protein